VVLYRSVARRDADEWSDIDMVVTGSDQDLTAGRMRKALGNMSNRLSVMYYPAEAFEEQYREHALSPD
jgi:predicted nucleotidyltransferase